MENTGIVIKDYGQQTETDSTTAAIRELQARGYSQVMTTREAQDNYVFLGFCAPWVVVERRSDGKQGSLEFTHSPRLYFNFVEDR